jgi:hypothetical protein
VSTRNTRATDGWIDLLSEILCRSPKLPGARCRGMPELFDYCTNSADIPRAVAICEQCQESEPCARWAQRQTHLSGVIGGRHHWARQPKSEGTQQHDSA